jgi:hypothetical protein
MDARRRTGPRNGRDREDLIAEIGGGVRSGISMLQSNLTVAEISKIASSLLPFGQEEANKGEPVVGTTKEVLVVVWHISTQPDMTTRTEVAVQSRNGLGGPAPE